MKKRPIVVLACALIFISLMSCSKATAPEAGSAKATDMLSLLPVDAKGAIIVDVHRIMETDFAKKSLAESKDKAKYDEFVQTTGIDPQQDVFFLSAR